MAFHHDLLEQAEHLAAKERKKPKQASLRRAVSATYYALFHLLVDEAVRRFVKGPGSRSLRNVLRRAFDHAEMRSISKAFSGGTLPQALAYASGGPIPPDLKRTADAFVGLQEARHEADYDLSRRFARAEVQDLIADTREAMRRWNAVRDSEAARLYLAALLTGERLRRRAS
jgi:uncharacterized protein (UPF0332 family)